MAWRAYPEAHLRIVPSTTSTCASVSRVKIQFYKARLKRFKMRFRNLASLRINSVILLTLSLVTATIAQQSKPAPAPARWRPLLGEYVNEDLTITILEKD